MTRNIPKDSKRQAMWKKKNKLEFFYSVSVYSSPRLHVFWMFPVLRQILSKLEIERMPCTDTTLKTPFEPTLKEKESLQYPSFSLLIFPLFIFSLFAQKLLQSGISRRDSNMDTHIQPAVYFETITMKLRTFSSRPVFLTSDKEDASVDRVLRCPDLRWRTTGVFTQSGSRSIESSASLSSLKPTAQSSSSTSTVSDVFNEFCWEIRQSAKMRAAVKIHWMIWRKGSTAQFENARKTYWMSSVTQSNVQ